MEADEALAMRNRRKFLLTVLPVGSLVCLGCRYLMASASSERRQEDVQEGEVGRAKHKFQADSQMSFEAVFSLAFRNYYIPSMNGLASEIGRGKLLDMLKRQCSDRAAEAARRTAARLPKNDFGAFVEQSKSQKNRFVQHVLTDEVLEQTDSFVHTRITECLWSKVFREADAADIGFATVCYPDFAMTTAFNPRIKLVRPTTLMEGHDCCDFLYYWE